MTVIPGDTYAERVLAGTLASRFDSTPVPETVSPILTGDPTAPTALAGDSDASIATTSFVQTAVATAVPKTWVDTDTTLASNSDSKLASQKAAKTYIDGTSVPRTWVDTDTTFAANSDSKVPSQKAAKTYVDSTTVPSSYLDTDTSLTANSDSKVASQKATKAYVDGHASTSTHTVVAAPTGVGATDTANIQAAIDAVTATVSGSAPRVVGGGVVELQLGQYLVTGLVLKPMVRFRGQARGLTTVKLANGANVDVIKGQNFATLAGTDSITGSVYGASVESMTIDGNKANNSSGRGLAVYGYANRFDDLRITNCAQLGFIHDSHATGSFGSDSLATGTMELEVGVILVDRCDGGGVDMQGPSDSQFSNVILAKNGPASNTTTVGFKNSRNALTTQITQIHIWGNTHKYGLQVDAAIDAVNVEIEGATDSNLWLRSSGSRIVNVDIYPPGAPNAYGIRIGDTSGSIFGSGNTVLGGRLKDCGVFFDKDGGDNTLVFESYWSDSSKTLFTGTPRASIGNRYNIRRNPSFGPTAALGSLGALAEKVAMTSDIPSVRCQGYPVGTLGASLFDSFMADAQNLALHTTGKAWLVRVPVVPGDTISNVNWMSGSTAGTGLTHLWTFVADVTSLNQLAISLDDTTATWTADTLISTLARTVATPYVVPGGVTAVYAGLAIVGSGIPTFEGHQFQQSGMVATVPTRSGQSLSTGLSTPNSLPNPVGATSSSSSKCPVVWLT